MDEEYFQYSIPIGPNARDFGFSLPNDLTEAEADIIVQVVALLLPAMVEGERPHLELWNGPETPAKEEITDTSLPDVSSLISKNGESENKPATIPEFEAPEFNLSLPGFETALRATAVKRGMPLPPGRWATHWDACRDCGGTDRKHKGSGFCSTCWDRLGNKAAIEATRRQRTDASTNGTVVETVPTPMRKAKWPLFGISGSEALKCCCRLRAHWDGKNTLDEIAIIEGLNLDTLRKVADTFRSDIDNAMNSTNFEESIRKAWDKRYES